MRLAQVLSFGCTIGFVLVGFILGSSRACADVLEPGLWKIITRIESGGAMSPPQQSAKCVTPEQASDVATTFSPAPRMINSECGALERSLEGTRLRWKLVCTGQLNMELTGDYTFIDPQHYAATTGRLMSETRTTLYAERVSECP
jgi:hypothetical protein